jgi:hypothetical protein
LLPQLSSAEVEESSFAIRKAIISLEFEDDATVVLISPHGRDARVYSGADGSLAGFGMTDVRVTAPLDGDAIERLADDWVWPSSSEEIDHGISVPLALGAAKMNRIVPVSLPETTGPTGGSVEKAFDEARSLVRALSKLAAGKDVVVMASANTSAGLSGRAPLTHLSGAARVEERLLDALETDVGMIEGIVEELHEAGGACGAAPLLCMSLLFGGKAARLLSYGSPVGVGYPVAQIAV